jgi:hypothetical protein
MRWPDLYSLVKPPLGSTIVGGELIEPRRQRYAQLQNHGVYAEVKADLVRYTKLEPSALALKRVPLGYLGVLDTGGSFYFVSMTSLGVRADPIPVEQEREAFATLSQLADEEQALDTAQRRQESTKEHEAILSKAERGHRAYTRRDPRSGKTVQVKAKGGAPAAAPRGVESLPLLEKERWDDGSEVSYRQSPFPMGKKPFVPGWLMKQAQVEQVNLRDLHSSQSRVTEHGVQQYLKAPPGKEKPEDLPIVYRTHDGHSVIQDGHHRLTAAHLRGAAVAHARVVHVPENLDDARKGDSMSKPFVPLLRFPDELEKALPRGGGEDEAKPKPAAKASKQQVGENGRTRYSYPGEAEKKRLDRAVNPKAPNAEPNAPNDVNPEEGQPPVQDPIQAAKPSEKSVEPEELANALEVSVHTLRGIAKRFQDKPALGGKEGFQKFMATHLKEFIAKHKLDADYFSLLYDNLTGQNLPQSPAAKPATQKA